jgi:hypothetical protein
MAKRKVAGRSDAMRWPAVGAAQAGVPPPRAAGTPRALRARSTLFGEAVTMKSTAILILVLGVTALSACRSDETRARTGADTIQIQPPPEPPGMQQPSYPDRGVDTLRGPAPGTTPGTTPGTAPATTPGTGTTGTTGGDGRP